MTREDIIRMAADSNLQLYGLGRDWEKFVATLERFAALVAAAEREACAKVCDRKAETMAITGKPCDPDDLAAAIRARGQA